jgi:transposase
MCVDAAGIPITLQTASAQVSEYNTALPTVNSINVPDRPLHPRKLPEALVADRGHDAKWLRLALRKKGIKPQIPKRRKPGETEEPAYNTTIKDAYKNRYVVERTFSWLGWNRRLLVRYEYDDQNYEALIVIACIMICLRRVLQ